MNYWLIKSEPEKYSIDKLQSDKTTFWDGIRNYQARNNLKEMKVGDLCLFYHSNLGKEIVGLARVIREFYQDPTTKVASWVAVDVAFEEKFDRPIGLAAIKERAELSQMVLVKNTRLSVQPVKAEEFDLIIRLCHPDK